MAEPIGIRFWSKVETGPGCWMWIGSLDKKGYGRFMHDGRCALAHRVSYYLAYGGIPGGLHVLHTCDNPGCVNPDHLWLGTNLDNVLDSSKKKRRHTPRNQGGSNPSSKVSEKDIEEIKDRLSQGFTQVEVAQEYGLSKASLSRIANNQAWKEVGANERG